MRTIAEKQPTYPTCSTSERRCSHGAHASGMLKGPPPPSQQQGVITGAGGGMGPPMHPPSHHPPPHTTAGRGPPSVHPGPPPTSASGILMGSVAPSSSSVTTVKQRFTSQPEFYHKFLEILRTYEKEQRGIKWVLDEVSVLFADHADLLKEFTSFLPNAVQSQAKAQLVVAGKKAESRARAQQQSVHHIQTEEVVSNDNVRLDFQGDVCRKKWELDLPVPQAKRNCQSDTNLSLLDAYDDVADYENNFSSNDMNTSGVSDHEMATKKALISLLDVDANTVSSGYLRQMILQMQITSKKLQGHIIHPEDYNNDDFHSVPEEPQRESRSKSKKRLGSEMRRIADHLGAGLHYHAAAPVVALLSSENNNSRQRIAKSKQSIDSKKMVIRRHWKDDGTVSRSNNVPIHYGIVPEEVFNICMKLKRELLGQSRSGKLAGRAMICRVDEVNPGYFRGHLSEEVSEYLMSLEILPAGFKIKSNASQQSIIFFNNEDGTSGCHFDRDSSLLYLVSGYKEVRIAPPMDPLARPGSGNVDELDPFSLDAQHHGECLWEEIIMFPGSVLFIPQYWLHCVRSVGDPNTIALSFQVEPKNENAVPTRWKPSKPVTEPVPRIDMEMEDENEPSEYDYPSSPLISSLDNVQNSSNQMDDDVLPEYTKSSFLGVSCPPPISASSCQGHLPWVRRSERQKLNCGICFRPAFVADGGPATEAWILSCNREHPLTIPPCPTAIPQHIICFRCCPMNRQGHIEPGELVEHLNQGRRPILTIDEFCINGVMKKAYFKYYTYSTGSKVDYEAKCLCQRQVSLNDFFPNICKSSVRIKSEEPEAPVSSISSWKRTRLRSICGICSEPAFDMERRYKSEAWILCFHGEKQPTHCPDCPTTIPKHLICFRCCPRGNENIKPQKVIVYPDNERRPLLTVNEFCMKGNYRSHCFGYYEFMTGSEVDYAKIINRQALLDNAGEDFSEMF